MSTGNVLPIGAMTSNEQTASSSQPEMKGLGEDAFMTLLLAQLKNQDPLKPMEDKDFIAQLAQFNSLSQLTQMNETLSALMTAQSMAQGSALIGKMVSGLSSDGEAVNGLVSGLRLTSGNVMLDVDGQTVPIDTVHSVHVPESEPEV